jgi:hypothetical protein
MSSTERGLRITIAALMHATGETQADLGRGIGLGQTQVSRRQAGATPWTLADIDRLAAHYGIAVSDLLAGTDNAVRCLPTDRWATHRRDVETVQAEAGTDGHQKGGDGRG